ncbi:MAG: nitrogenase iron protein, partial [Oscillospiraceae bacterium]
PMRRDYADKVFIITSGENMAIHAAANIATAVENFRERDYAELGGLILNRRGVKREEEKVGELAKDIHTPVVGALDFSETVQEAEELHKTVIEAFPESEIATQYRTLAEAVLAACGKELLC